VSRSEAYYDHVRMMQDAMPDITELRQKSVRGRKEHQCTWCKKPILIGELHRYTVYLDGDDCGKLKTSRECGRCIVGAYDDPS